MGIRILPGSPARGFESTAVVLTHQVQGLFPRAFNVFGVTAPLLLTVRMSSEHCRLVAALREGMCHQKRHSLDEILLNGKMVSTCGCVLHPCSHPFIYLTERRRVCSLASSRGC